MDVLSELASLLVIPPVYKQVDSYTKNRGDIMSADLYRFVAELTPEELVYLLYSKKSLYSKRHFHKNIRITPSLNLD